MPDVSKTIEDFNGENEPVIAETWLRQFQNMSVLHNWLPAFIFQTAFSHLKGAAKFWYKANQNDITDCVKFNAAFKKTFVFEKSKTDSWLQMQERMQKARENISVYFYEKLQRTEPEF